MDLLDKMATYVRVVESGSLSAAARQLRISAGAVSRQIATLEAELRAPLLERTTRRMTVTPAGRDYYQRCLHILREVDDAQTLGRGVDGPLGISAPVSFGLACVVPHMRSLMAGHPGLRVDLRLEDRIIDLALEGIDVAIRVGIAPRDSPEMVAQRLFAFRRILVAAPAYLRRRGEPKTPEGLGRHDALGYLIGPPSDHWILTREDAEARIHLNTRFRSTSLHALKQLAVEGAGITLLPEWFVRDEVGRRALRVILPGWQTEPVTVDALYRVGQRGAPRVRALVEHLRNAYRS